MNATNLIEKLGGTAAVARLLGIKPPSVSEWKKSGLVPRESMIFLAPIAESMGIATRVDLLGDDAVRIWPDLSKESEKEGV